MTVGLLLAAVLACITVFVLWRASARTSNADSFLVAGRNVPLGRGVVTLTANWLQAPALLASGALAYQSAYHFGAFWVPNVLALIVPVFFVLKVREVVPRGFTVPEYIGKVYGPTVRTLFALSALTALAFAVGFTITGLSQWLQPLLGISTWQISATIGVFAFAWVILQGLPGAIRGDIVKVAVIVLGMVGVIVLWFYRGPSLPATPLTNWAPVSFWSVLWVVGVPFAASLIGGPICNPDLGERVYALDKQTIRGSYIGAATFFGIGVIVFGSLGYLAHFEFAGKFAGFPAFAVLNKLGDPTLTIVVSVALAVILTAAVASYIASAGDLVAIEIYRRFVHPSASDKEIVWASRITMPLPILIGTILANVDGVSVPSLLASLAVVRGEAIVPMLLAVYCTKQVNGVAIAAGMLVGFFVGVPLTYAEFFFGSDQTFLIANGKPIGALVAVGAPLVVFLIDRALASTRIKLA